MTALAEHPFRWLRFFAVWTFFGLVLGAWGGTARLLAESERELLSGDSPALSADDWPQYRGPRGDGHSGATDLPLNWSESENVVWKKRVPGRGWSSPVVLGDRLWMTTALETLLTPEEKKRRLADNEYESTLALATTVSLRAICLDRSTGELLYNVELFDVDDPEPIHKLNSYATPTPVVEPGRLYCDFGTYGVACLDAATGEVLWKRDLPVEHQVGPGSSPVLFDELLVLVRDGCDVQYVTALDKRNGEIVWKTDRPAIDLDDEFKKAFSTPLLVEHDGRQQVIAPGAKWVVSYDPASGEPLWRVDYVKGYSNVARPVFGHGMAYVCTNGPGRQIWAIRAGGTGDVTDSHVVWKARRQMPNKASPLLVGSELYAVTDNGVLACLDAETGKIHSSHRLGGNYSASPIFADGRIYTFGEEGKTSVFRPGTKPELLAENSIEGLVVASPAIAGKAIFLRTDSHLYRIEKQ